MPVALNLYTARKAEDAGGELFRSVQKQKPQYQGIWIVSPDGKVLAAQHDFRSDKDQEKVRETLYFIDGALRAFGPVKPRPDEVRWLQIPWVQDLSAAAKLSKAENRPLLIWASGDEPLERC